MFDRLYGTQNPTPLDSDAKKDTRGLKRRLFGSDNDGDYAVAVSPPRLKRQVTARKEGLRSQRLLDQDESGQRPRSPIRRKQYSVAPMLTRYQARRSPSPPVEHRLASRLESKSSIQPCTPSMHPSRVLCYEFDSRLTPEKVDMKTSQMNIMPKQLRNSRNPRQN